MGKRASNVGDLRRRLNTVPYLPADYDDQLMQYVDAHRGRFQIRAPAGTWEPYLEYPGYIAWVPGDGMESHDYVAAGIGWDDPHTIPFQVEDVHAELDLGPKLTGDLERDAVIYRDAIQELMARHRDAITRMFGPSWVPSTVVAPKAHAWGIPRA